MARLAATFLSVKSKNPRWRGDLARRALVSVRSALFAARRALDLVRGGLVLVRGGLDLVRSALLLTRALRERTWQAMSLLQCGVQFIQFAREFKRQMFAENLIKLADGRGFGAPFVGVHACQFFDGVRRNFQSA